MDDLYTDGEYLAKNPTWHSEDSLWKATQIKKMIQRNSLSPNSISDVGCGAGQVLKHLSSLLPNSIQYSGYEISPQAYELCQKNQNENISYHLNDFTTLENKYFDVVLVIDVIEHIKDMFGFLEGIKDKGKYKVFHIPLEIFSLNVLLGSPINYELNNHGHIHFFTKDIALKSLEVTGYEIIDYFYTPCFEVNPRSFLSTLGYIPQKISYQFNNDFLLRVFGGVSLLVLTT